MITTNLFIPKPQPGLAGRKQAEQPASAPARPDVAAPGTQLPGGRFALQGIRFGNATPAQATSTTGIKPESVLFTENVGLDTNNLRSLSMVAPEMTWPLYLMKILLRDQEVRRYVEDYSGIKRFDVFHGVDKNALPFFRKELGNAEGKLADSFYRNKMLPSINKFAAENGYQNVTPVVLWNWLMSTRVTERLDEILTACTFDKKEVNGVEIGPFDQETIKKLKNVPPLEPPVTGPQEPEKPKKLEKAEILALRKVLTDLPKIVLGQKDAIQQVVKGIRVARNGYVFDKSKPNRPKVRMLLLGPSGVGKTFTAKQMAKLMGRPVVYVPLSQFGDASTASSFQGSAAGYIGSKDKNVLVEIREAVEKSKKDGTPPPLIILDELEKSAPEVREAFMQALDEGVMYTNDRKPVYFRDCDIIMTSNIAQIEIADAQVRFEDEEKDLLTKARELGLSQEEIDEKLGELHLKQNDEMEKIVDQEMNTKIARDFKGRISSKVIFKSLTEATAREILDQQLKTMAEAAREREGYTLEIDQSFKDHLIEKGFTRDTGVRKLSDEIDAQLNATLVEDVEDLVLADAPLEGGTIKASWKNGKPVYKFLKPGETEEPPAAQDTAPSAQPALPAGETSAPAGAPAPAEPLPELPENTQPGT